MHYKNGREVQIGDSVIGRDYNGLPISGVVITKTPGNTCNVGVAPVPLNLHTLTAGREVQIGDSVIGRDYNGLPISGVVITKTPGNTCNVGVAPVPHLHTLTAGELLHLDDAFPKDAAS
jgi:hypothetical protein